MSAVHLRRSLAIDLSRHLGSNQPTDQRPKLSASFSRGVSYYSLSPAGRIDDPHGSFQELQRPQDHVYQYFILILEPGTDSAGFTMQFRVGDLGYFKQSVDQNIGKPDSCRQLVSDKLVLDICQRVAVAVCLLLYTNRKHRCSCFSLRILFGVK